MTQTQLHKRASLRVGRAVLAALVVFLICPVLRAQLALSPTIIESTAYPGGLRTVTLSVSNSGRDKLDCTVSVSGMRVERGGLPVPVDEAPRSCKEWVSYEPQKFALAPKEGKKIVCHIRVPGKASGGYYALISCHGIPTRGDIAGGEREGTRAGVRFSHRVMAALLLTVPGADMKAVIDAGVPMITVKPGLKGYSIGLPVRTRGNTHMRMAGHVEVRSEAGQLVERFEMKAGRGFILPMHERLFESRGRVNLPDGAYVGKVQLQAKEARRPMQFAFPFYVADGKPVVAEPTDELRAKLEKEAAGFTVSPPQLGVRLRGGGRRSEAVELANMTRETLKLQATIVEWERASDGTDLVIAEKPSHGRSGLDILSLRQQDIELRPLARQRVPLLVSLPKDLTGERYAAVTFDRADIQLDASPKGRARRSALIGVHALGTGAYQSKIAGFEATRQPNGAIRLAVNIKNAGDLSITPEVTFYINDEKDVRVGKTGPPTRAPFILAGGEAVVSGEWKKVLDPGEYTAVVSMRYSPKDPPLSARTAFVVPKPAAAPPADKAGKEAKPEGDAKKEEGKKP